MVEAVVAVGLIAILTALLLPAIKRARTAASQIACASNLRQVGIGLTQYFTDCRSLPVRANLLAYTNPNVMKYQDEPDTVADVMQRYVKSRAVFYCPANSLRRTVDSWWPYTSGTIAGSYQYPFWLNSYEWLIPYPNYQRLTSDTILAADYLGAMLDYNDHLNVVAWNHEKLPDGSPCGMNMLYGDGHVQWHASNYGFQVYGGGFENVYWFYSKQP